MSRTVRMGLVLGLLAALVGAQGRRGGEDGALSGAALTAHASTAYVQADFLRELGEAFGDTADTRLAALSRAGLEPREVMDLLNKPPSTSKIEKMFRVGRGRAKVLSGTLEDVIRLKDRRVFFGILAVVMIREHDVAPDSEFLKTVLAARDAMSDDDFDKIVRRGVRGAEFVGKAFGLRDPRDRDDFSDMLRSAFASYYMHHPLCGSLGHGKASDGELAKFPKLVDGMAGFGDNKDGTAGGLPFDLELPPCPFAGKNLAALMKPKK